MSATIASLLPRFRLMAPLLPEPVATFALREAAIEFCRQTEVVTEVLPSISVAIGDATYSLATTADPTNTRGVAALNVWLDGAELTPITASELAEEFGDWTDDTGAPTRYMQFTEGELRLYPIPTAVGTLTVRAATAPTTGATTVDNVLADRWWKAVVAGALLSVYNIPDQPFTKPDQVPLQAAIFSGFVDEAKGKAYKGYTKARRRTRAHSF